MSLPVIALAVCPPNGGGKRCENVLLLTVALFCLGRVINAFVTYSCWSLSHKARLFLCLAPGAQCATQVRLTWGLFRRLTFCVV